MKYLKILLQTIKIKGDENDPETLQADLYEKVQCLLDAETLTFEVVDDEDSDSDD